MHAFGSVSREANAVSSKPGQGGRAVLQDPLPEKEGSKESIPPSGLEVSLDGRALD